jgi:hypothetical protein
MKQNPLFLTIQPNYLSFLAYRWPCKNRIHCFRVLQESNICFQERCSLHGMTNEVESTVLDNTTKLPKLFGVLLAMQKQNPLFSCASRNNVCVKSLIHDVLRELIFSPIPSVTNKKLGHVTHDVAISDANVI